MEDNIYTWESVWAGLIWHVIVSGGNEVRVELKLQISYFLYDLPLQLLSQAILRRIAGW
jgi:hypothetical protein